jgi:hypothetical protein
MNDTYVSPSQIIALLKDHKTILTAIMFVVENFDKRVNTIEMRRGIRLDYIFATLRLIQSNLEKSYEYLQYIRAHSEQNQV